MALQIILWPAPAHAAETFPALVVKVYDGDTITAEAEGRGLVKVRLYGIDAPELRQLHGKGSRARLNDLAMGREVIIQAMDIDRYGRTVALVWAKGGRLVNMAMVEAGWAWVYPQYCKDKTVCPALAARQGEAEAARRGLWGGKARPPWEWRG
jgi:endonuclease YncB( thermonuclease family)